MRTRNASGNAPFIMLACGLTSLINMLDPEVVIMGGGIAGAGELLFHPLQHHLDRIEWRPTGTQVRLVRAQLGEIAGAVGAAYNAMLDDE